MFLCACFQGWFVSNAGACRDGWEARVCLCVCVRYAHLAQSLQQDGDARQSLGSPLVVTVTKHETHQLWISGTHRLLKN